VSSLVECVALCHLDLSGLRITSVASLAETVSLMKLNLSNCSDLLCVSALARCESLLFLNLSGCTGLQNVSALGQSTSLQQINLNRCSGLKEAPDWTLKNHGASLKTLISPEGRRHDFGPPYMQL